MNLLKNQQTAETIDAVYLDLEDLLMENIARHLSDWNQTIDTDRWLMKKLAEIGALNKENIKIIAKMAGIGQRAAEEILYELADEVIDELEPGFMQLAKAGYIDETFEVPKSDNVTQVMEKMVSQAKDKLNLTNTTMLHKAQDAFKGLARNIAKNAIEIMNNNTAAVVTGAESRQQALQRAIKQFANEGITGFVDKRGRNWTPEAYVNMCMRTTVASTAHEIQTARCEDYGIDLIEIDSHSGARPKCAKDQGKIYDLKNGSGHIEDLYGKEIEYYPWNSSSYGEPDGILGINCRHHKYPFVPNVSVQTYFPTKDMDANNKLYKETQVQRAMERDIRKQKRACMMYDKVGDQDAFEEASAKLKEKEKRLENYLDGHKDLHRRKDREQVVGFDKSISKKVTAANKRYTKAQNTDTIPIKDTIIHKSVGAKFKNYKVIDKETDIEYEFAPGTRIQNSEVFAGKGTKHTLHDGVAEGLTKEYGGEPSKWQHAKGFGVLLDAETGEEYQAEVHWFQEETVGKVKFKVKRWLDDEG